MSDQIICEAPIPTPVTSDMCKPSSPHAPPPPASSGSSAPSHQNKSSQAPSAAADSGAEQPATDATSSSTQPASTRWVSNGGNGQQEVPQQDAGSSLGGSLEEGDDEEEEEDGEGLEGLEGAYGVQALLSLLDKSKVGMYEPDVARDVLTLVEGATVVGDLPNKHPDLVSEFCHALTDDHTYYSNLLASLCDGEDETNDEDLIHIAKSVKGAVYSITNPPEPPPSPTPSPTSCSSPPAPATSASLSEADDSQGASAGVTGTTENKAGDVENEASKPRPAAPPPPPPPPPPTRAPPPPPPVGASPAAKSFTPMVPALKVGAYVVCWSCKLRCSLGST
ncbi:hypothetical protein DUNSADRAFT_2110 [Dunaliella salina]|uniref:Uncharacterized protein n=1 Tax=Dunaliella salina TaxID=3046 RepID=A0ABQ7GW66_DUNSA|nr:hypothetical protein DUNSADRAFT_2110 [Dunaliella salina]|eukprot:KAF5838852.1 hypothetical protein DUNSADRAFT_2110 [Dunaliella salina]